MNKEKAHRAVDFDGTLAFSGDDTTWNGPLGAPIPKMVKRVKKWLAKGENVRIFTARVSPYNEDGNKQQALLMAELIDRIEGWCHIHLGQALEITCSKDHNTIKIYDDKARQIIRNTGRQK